MLNYLETLPEGQAANLQASPPSSPNDTMRSALEQDRDAVIAARKEEAKKARRKKKRTVSSTSLASNTFQELYRLTGEVLGQGAYASVQTCVNLYTEVEYAVKIIDKTVPTHSRRKKKRT